MCQIPIETKIEPPCAHQIYWAAGFIAAMYKRGHAVKIKLGENTAVAQVGDRATVEILFQDGVATIRSRMKSRDPQTRKVTMVARTVQCPTDVAHKLLDSIIILVEQDDTTCLERLAALSKA